ncbi:MAG: DNA translocase FtsK 4TM domain-containing protein, partial [Patescibacteria group bacterium]
MAKKEREKERKNGRRKRADEAETSASPVSVEALRGVCAVLAVAFAIFLSLAAFEIGGAVGAFLFSILSKLLGVGYMLLPLSLLLLATALLRSFQNRFGAIEIASVVVFLVSSLSLVAIAFPEKGGVLGTAIVTPLVAAVDTAASVIFLMAFVVASVIIAFDIHLSVLFAALRERMRSPLETPSLQDDDMAIEGLPEDDEDANDDDDGDGCV